MDRLLSPASGLPDTMEPFRSLFHLQSFPKARMHQDKEGDHGGNNPECAGRLASLHNHRSEREPALGFSQAGMQVSSQHSHVKNHLHFRDHPGCSLTGMEQRKESPFPSSMSSFEVGRIKLLSPAWKIGSVGRDEEPGSSGLL